MQLDDVTRALDNRISASPYGRLIGGIAMAGRQTRGLGLILGSIEEPLSHVYGGSQATAVVRFGDGYLAFGHVNGGCCDGGFTTESVLSLASSVRCHSPGRCPRSHDSDVATDPVG